MIGLGMTFTGNLVFSTRYVLFHYHSGPEQPSNTGLNIIRNNFYRFGDYYEDDPNDVGALFYNQMESEHYDNVMRDMFGCLDKHLASNEYMADHFSVADISMFADVHIYGDKKWIGFNDYPHLKRWHDSIEKRPAVDRAWGPYE